jgi:phosphoglycolate phosphatase-like HAD superfamily hydrolase
VKLQFPAVIFDLDGTLVEPFSDLVDIVQNGSIDA